MNNRYLGALIISPFIIFIFLGGYYLMAFCFAISLIGMHEFFSVIRKKGFNPFEKIAYLAAVMYYVILIVNRNQNYLGTLLVILTLVLLCIPVIEPKYNFVDAALSLLSVIYIPILFSLITLINQKLCGNVLVWLVFITAWGCDTSAYYAGRFLGKNKLCPKVSPKKTVEGSIGGVVGSTLVALIFGYIIEQNYNVMDLINYPLIGMLCGIICQFGDLVASSIKRYAGVKDYSNLIPGHGGILDRFDSIIYSAAAVFYYLTIVLKM
ncbi:MAG: phosphatidate cytidylyltransferase [Bacillota bacterium]|nr:phosphatidate cytidylyltransferase [Bacillota bacterium]